MVPFLQRYLRRAGRRRSHLFIDLLGVLLILAICISITFAGLHILWGGPGFSHGLARSLLSWGMPAIDTEHPDHPGWTYTLRSILYMLTDYDPGNPVSAVESVMPLLVAVHTEHQWMERSFVFVPELTAQDSPRQPRQRPPAAEPDRVPQEPEREHRADRPRVLIYHTHTSEMYLGNEAQTGGQGASHYVFKSVNDEKITGVMEVGRHLAKALEQHGIEAIHETRIHDFPSIALSYANSEKTVSRILSQNESIDLIIDVHRDANVPEPTTTIQGRQVAKALLVVGSAQKIPVINQYWPRNLEAAQRVKDIADRMYPGLVRPIQVRADARFNQHLHPRSLLLEIGSVENRLDEALLTAELVANVLAQALRDGF